jgi:hypothetical protein
MMRRREFIAGLGAAAWPIMARAQQAGKLPTMGCSRRSERLCHFACRAGIIAGLSGSSP